jgi:hypothetical protein
MSKDNAPVPPEVIAYFLQKQAEAEMLQKAVISTLNEIALLWFPRCSVNASLLRIQKKHINSFFENKITA